MKENNDKSTQSITKEANSNGIKYLYPTNNEKNHPFNLTPVHNDEKLCYVKDAEGKPTNAFLGATSLKLAHFFLSQIEQLQAPSIEPKIKKICNQPLELSEDIQISSHLLAQDKDPYLVREKLGKDKLLVIPANQIKEWEMQIKVYLPLNIPIYFYLKLSTYLRNIPRHVLSYLGNIPLTAIANLKFETKYLVDAFMLCRFIQSVENKLDRLGFENSESWNLIANKTLSQLGENYIKHIPGCYFLDNNNQLDETLTELVLLSQGCIDFRQPHSFKTYFELGDNNIAISWQNNGRELLKNHLKNIYHNLFYSAHLNKINILSLSPLFKDEYLQLQYAYQEIIKNLPAEQAKKFKLPSQNNNLFSEIIKDIKKCYAEAFFEILQIHNYPFTELFCNPGSAYEEYKEALLGCRSSFTFPITIHNKDSINLAKNYKKQYPSYIVAFNNADNPVQVFCGHHIGGNFGKYSEEKDNIYGTTEKLVGNSTYLLGTSLITNADFDPNRVFMIDNNYQSLNIYSLTNKEQSFIQSIQLNEKFHLLSKDQNPFLKIHDRFMNIQLLEGEKDKQFEEFASLITILQHAESLEDRYETMRTYCFTLPVSFTGEKYFSARKELIDLTHNVVNTKLMTTSSITKFNFKWNTSNSTIIPHTLDSAYTNNNTDESLYIFEAYYQQFRATLVEMSLKPDLSSYEQDYLTELNIPITKKIEQNHSDNCLIM